MLTNNNNKKILGNNSCPQLAKPTILLNVEETVKINVDPHNIPSKKGDFQVSQMSEKNNKNSTVDMSRFTKNIKTNGYSKTTTEIIIGSWKNNTKNEHKVYLKHWEFFYQKKRILTHVIR